MNRCILYTKYLLRKVLEKSYVADYKVRISNEKFSLQNNFNILILIVQICYEKLVNKIFFALTHKEMFWGAPSDLIGFWICCKTINFKRHLIFLSAVIGF